MSLKDAPIIEEIETRICELQIAHVSLQEQLTQSKNTAERTIEGSALRIIDILDLIEMAKLNSVLHDQINFDSQLIIKKIEKRLLEILKSLQVHEIIFKENQIEIGKTRVIETRNVSHQSSGTIVEICRKGYQRGDKTIRPTDVITAA